MLHDKTWLEMINESRKRHGEKLITWKEFCEMQSPTPQVGRKRIHDLYVRKKKSGYNFDPEPEKPSQKQRPPAVYSNQSIFEKYNL